MYLKLYILFIVLSYNCLSIYCTFQFNNDKYQSAVATKKYKAVALVPADDDCAIPLPKKKDHKAPIPSPLIAKRPHANYTKRNRYLYVKKNTFFKVACPLGKYISVARQFTREILVRCIKGQIINFGGNEFNYTEIVCDDIPKSRKSNIDNVEEFIGTTSKPQLTRKEIMRRKFYPGFNGCIIPLLRQDNNMPIPYTTNTAEPTMIRPDLHGNLKVLPNDIMRLSCTNHKFVYPTRGGTNEIVVKCLNGSLVEYKNKTFEFFSFRCKSIPTPTLVATKTRCQSINSKVLEVGFKTRKGFLTSYKICFDMKNKNAQYSWYHVSSPISDRRQVPKVPFTFMKAQEFESIDPAAAYGNQTRTLQGIVGSRELANWYIRRNNEARFLTQAHLVSEQDFLFAFEQYATYFQENTSPQFTTFTTGVWNNVNVRLFKRFVQRSNGGTIDRIVVTGTFLTTHIKDKDLIQRPFTLCPQKKMSVPRFFWKLDYCTKNKNGMVYILLNNPWPEIHRNVTICDVSPCPNNMDYFKKRSDILYCCTMDAFEQAYGKIDRIVFKIKKKNNILT